MYYTFLSTRWIYLAVAIYSIVLTPWVYDPLRAINPDGYLYLWLAKMAQGSGIPNAYYHIGILYPYLIGFLSKNLSLSLIQSAYIINLCLLAGTAVLFVRVVKQLGGDVLTQACAALVILSFSLINEYRFFIIRDHGYLFFMLLGLSFFLSFVANAKWRYAWLSSISLFIGVLFRIEGIITALLMPLIPFLLKEMAEQSRSKAVIKLYSLILSLFFSLAFIVIFLCFTLNPLAAHLIQETTSAFNRHVSFSPLANWQLHAHLLLTQVLSPAAKIKASYTILFFGLSGYFIFKLMSSLGWFNLFLGGKDNLSPRSTMQPQHRRILWAFIVISCIAPIYFLFNALFLSARYVALPCLYFLIFVPFGLVALYNSHLSAIFKKTILILYVLISVYQIAHDYYKATWHTKKNVVAQAKIWLQEHHAELTNVCANTGWAVFIADPNNLTSFPQIALTVEEFFKQSKNCQYLVLTDSSTQPIILNKADKNRKLLKIIDFSDKKERISIYKMLPNRK